MLDQRPLHSHDPVPVHGPTRVSDASTFAQTERPSHPSEVECLLSSFSSSSKARSSGYHCHCPKRRLNVPYQHGGYCINGIGAVEYLTTTAQSKGRTSPTNRAATASTALEPDLAPVHGWAFTTEKFTSDQAIDAAVQITAPTAHRRHTGPSVKIIRVLTVTAQREGRTSPTNTAATASTALEPGWTPVKAHAPDLAPVHRRAFTDEIFTSSQAIDAADSPPAPVHGSFLVIQTIYLLFVQRGDNGQWQ